MSSLNHDEEEWLHVADVDAFESSDAGRVNVPIRGAAHNSSQMPTPNDGAANSTKLDVAPVDTGPLYHWMRKNADELLKSGAPIFHTDLGGDDHILRDVFHQQLPPEHRQEFSCSACHRFMKKYGGLAMVDAKTGNLRPLFWHGDIDSDFFRPSVRAVADFFAGKRVRSAFAITDKTIKAGIAQGGGFHHMSFTFPASRLQRPEPKGLSSATTVVLAEMLGRVLADNQPSTIFKAADLLLEHKLPHADEHEGAIRWLRDLVGSGQLSQATDDISYHNLLYLAAAKPFLGCIHQLRSGALSMLLGDIQADLPFQSLKARWSSLVDPHVYMRPTAAPSAGNIAVAERLFSELGLTKDDLKRKYLSMRDIPKEVFMYIAPTTMTNPPKPSGIFSDLIPPSESSPPAPPLSDDTSIPPSSLTFATFITSIVPHAQSIEYHLPIRLPLHFLITGHPGTSALMQWHSPTNLASAYTYHNPDPVYEYNLKPGWTPVSAIIPHPHLWEGVPDTVTLPLSDQLTQRSPTGGDPSNTKAYKHGHHGWRYVVCLEGIHDEVGSLCLFPTNLRREFHGVRATIEAYSNRHSVEALTAGEGGIVGGVSVVKSGGEMEHLFRVQNRWGGVGRYKVRLFQ